MKNTVLTLLIVAILAPQAWGADCLAVRKKISQERDMLRKRELTKQGLKDCPNDPVINFTYAYSMERFRKYKDALKHYKIATKLDPKYAKGYFGMADMYVQLNQPAKAIPAYEKGLSLEPKNKRASKSLAAAKAEAKKAGISIAAPAAAVVPVVAQNTPSKTKPAAPAAKTPPKKSTPAAKVASKTPGQPYAPQQMVVFQQSLNQLPVIALPLQGEKIQSIKFQISQKKDNTGLNADKKILAN